MRTTFNGLPRRFANPTELKGFTMITREGEFVLPLTSDEEDLKTLAQFRIDPDGLP